MISIAGEIYRPEFKLFPLSARCTSKCPLLCGETLLVGAEKMEDFNVAPEERAAARGFYDRENLYIQLRCKDRDIVSEVKSAAAAVPGNAADTVQIILKSEKEHGIWVINATVNNIANGFFFYSAGAVIPASSPKLTGIKVKISRDGSLNNTDDTDRSWEAWVTIPYTVFKNRDLKFTPDEKWTILVRRYNFGVHLKAKEVSSFPQMTIFKHYEPTRYARITFQK